MSRWPWIAREHHEEVVKELRDEISFLRYNLRRNAGYEEPMVTSELPPLPAETSVLGDPEALAAMIEKQARRRDGVDGPEEDGQPPAAIRRSMRKLTQWGTRKNAKNFQVVNMPAEVEAMLKKTESEARMMADLARRTKEAAN